MKLTAQHLLNMKSKQKINSLTCYDHQMALWLNESDIHFLLVGDSLSEVIYGNPSTREASMPIMQQHVAAVAKGAPQKHIMADMPAGSYSSASAALLNAKSFVRLGAASVKLENPKTEVVKNLVDAGIPVCGHVGLLPQTATTYKKVGSTESEAHAISADALRLVQAGVFMILLEAVNNKLSKTITAAIKVPTIGIASGENEDCTDGKILVLYDLLGITKNIPPFATNVAHNFGQQIKNVANNYCR